MRFPHHELEDLKGMVCACSTGRAAIVTGRDTLTTDLGEEVTGWAGIGLDGHGTWFSSSPVILSESAEDFRQKLVSRFGGKLTYNA